jgi:hypothetical protein
MNVLTVHVDDILLLSASSQDRDQFEKFLQRKYTLTTQRSNLSYSFQKYLNNYGTKAKQRVDKVKDVRQFTAAIEFSMKPLDVPRKR